MTGELQSLKRKIDELNSQAKEILELGVILLADTKIDERSNTSIYFCRYNYGSNLREKQREAIQQYQQWYSSARRLVEEHTPEWLSTFTSLYITSMNSRYGSNGVLEYLEMNRSSYLETREDLINEFVSDIDKQISILLSIPKIVEIKEMSLRQLISADLVRTEMDEAEVLLIAGHHRAAGVLAGVALELHLRSLCDIHNIMYAAKTTIDPLAQELYKAGKIDKIELNHVEYLASIRNKCSHAADVATREARTLIEEVRKMARRQNLPYRQS